MALGPLQETLTAHNFLFVFSFMGIPNIGGVHCEFVVMVYKRTTHVSKKRNGATLMIDRRMGHIRRTVTSAGQDGCVCKLLHISRTLSMFRLIACAAALTLSIPCPSAFSIVAPDALN